MARGAAANGDAKAELRLRLRLLTCSTMIEREARARSRRRFGATLPRFDALARLRREPDDLAMNPFGKRMLASNGDLTAMIGRLVKEGLASRRRSEGDGRVFIVALTAPGRAAFERMAGEREASIGEVLHELDDDDMSALMRLLAKAGDPVERARRGERRSHGA